MPREWACILVQLHADLDVVEHISDALSPEQFDKCCGTNIMRRDGTGPLVRFTYYRIIYMIMKVDSATEVGYHCLELLSCVQEFFTLQKEA